MRWCVVVALLCLTGCQPSFQFNDSKMTPNQMLDRATLVFVGVIQSQTFVNWPFLRIPGEAPKYQQYWRVLKRRVHVEIVAKGQESRKVIDIYEYYWIGGGDGPPWNITRNGHRYLFLVRNEGGTYHVVRDWRLSIFPIYSGEHDRFPLDASKPVWERFALLQFWVRPGYSSGLAMQNHLDPPLGPWRETKLLRGLLRHRDAALRDAACQQLLLLGQGQDECYYQLDPQSRARFGAYGAFVPYMIRQNRRWLAEFGQSDWTRTLEQKAPDRLEWLKLFTTVNDRKLREEFCEKFQRAFPDDHDNGCPADKPPPATIVTADGDVPLTGAWPTQ
ncbi:MAG TPA: hypothetical protein VMB25_20315 [Bryobacteraceae bacterium]|nr:hypothetical protein [Bryobacteraceae bacterium]